MYIKHTIKNILALNSEKQNASICVNDLRLFIRIEAFLFICYNTFTMAVLKKSTSFKTRTALKINFNFVFV